jgi:hypothetical protein
MKKVLFKILAYLLLDKVEKARAKKVERIESMKLSIKGLTDISHAHHL